MSDRRPSILSSQINIVDGVGSFLSGFDQMLQSLVKLVPDECKAQLEEVRSTANKKAESMVAILQAAATASGTLPITKGLSKVTDVVNRTSDAVNDGDSDTITKTITSACDKLGSIGEAVKALIKDEKVINAWNNLITAVQAIFTELEKVLTNIFGGPKPTL